MFVEESFVSSLDILDDERADNRAAVASGVIKHWNNEIDEYQPIEILFCETQTL